MRNRRLSIFSVLGLSLCLALICSCGGSDGGGGQETDDQSSGVTDVGQDPDTYVAPETAEEAADPDVAEDLGEPEEAYVPPDTDYPPAPYGKTPGSVIANLKFKDPHGGNVELADLYKHPDKKIVLLVASAGWCSACKLETVDLKAWYPDYADKGFEIWYTHFEDTAGKPVTMAYYQSWETRYGPNYPSYLDTEFVLGEYFNVSATPMNMLVDLETMEIVYLQTGYDALGIKNKVEQYVN